MSATFNAPVPPPGGGQVAILLASYNGERFLPEQLASFECQTHTAWSLWVSDDGSTDATLQLLGHYAQQWPAGRLQQLQGPAQGSSRNFLSLLYNTAIQADYYAYSDQDDIWEPDKLARAVAWLEQQPAGVPALYCTRTRLVDAAGQELGVSPLFGRPPAFANALVQNITGGNTMVFNDAARRLLLEVPADVPLVIHDWWTYIAVTAVGGALYFDPVPGVRYRQHGGNLIGMAVGGPALSARIRKLFTQEFRHNGDLIVAALKHLRPRLSPAALETLDLYHAARHSRLLPRLLRARRSGIYRLTPLGDLGLLAAILLNNF